MQTGEAEIFRSDLERQVRAEARHGWENARKRWAKPLPERVLAGRAIGWLRIAETAIVNQRRLVYFVPSLETSRETAGKPLVHHLLPMGREVSRPLAGAHVVALGHRA